MEKGRSYPPTTRCDSITKLMMHQLPMRVRNLLKFWSFPQLKGGYHKREGMDLQSDWFYKLKGDMYKANLNPIKKEFAERFKKITQLIYFESEIL
jgi:hypothetical protein